MITSVLAATLRSLQDFDSALLANTLLYIDPTPAEDIYFGGSIARQTPNIGPMVGVAVTCEIDSGSPGGHADIEPYFSQLDLIHGRPRVSSASRLRPPPRCLTVPPRCAPSNTMRISSSAVRTSLHGTSLLASRSC